MSSIFSSLHRKSAMVRKGKMPAARIMALLGPHRRPVGVVLSFSRQRALLGVPGNVFGGVLAPTKTPKADLSASQRFQSVWKCPERTIRPVDCLAAHTALFHTESQRTTQKNSLYGNKKIRMKAKKIIFFLLLGRRDCIGASSLCVDVSWVRCGKVFFAKELKFVRFINFWSLEGDGRTEKSSVFNRGTKFPIKFT